jgi:hypothetical protein
VSQSRATGAAAGGSLRRGSWHNLRPMFERPGWAGNVCWLSGARLDQHRRQAGDATGHALARGRVLPQALEGPRTSRPGDPAEMTADPGACAVPLVLLSQNQHAGPACPAAAVPG